jgi:hypothetical protein
MAKQSTITATVQTSGLITTTTTINTPVNSRMKKINVGTNVNAKDGDNIRAAFIKVNGNFDDLDTLFSTMETSLNSANAQILALQQSGGTGGTGNTVHRTYQFTNALRWFVNHNMNTRSFQETLTDAAGSRFFAKVKIIDSNNFMVDLTSATSGVIDVYFSN